VTSNLCKVVPYIPEGVFLVVLSAAAVRFGPVLGGVLSNLELNLGSGSGKESERWTRRL
jgi:hypothetical protein